MEMKRYKVLFVGIGSIARRHIRNMLDIGEQIGAQFEIDAFRRGTDKDYGISDVYQEISDVPDDYDIVFRVEFYSRAKLMTGTTEPHGPAFRTLKARTI